MLRRLLTFSLRRLFIYVAIISAPLGWIGYQRHQYRQQWKTTLKAVSLIDSQNGFLIYGQPSDIVPAIRGPIWYRTLLGDRFLERAQGVYFPALHRDADLAGLSDLKTLYIELIRIDNGTIDEEGLRFLKDLPHLSILGFRNTNISVEGWQHIGECRNLVGINIDGPSTMIVGQREIAAISKCKSLEHLALTGVQISQNSCDKLAKIGSLNSLSLSRTDLSGNGCGSLWGLFNLKELDLSYSTMDDAGLEKLTLLPSLETLHLMDSSVHGAGLKSLSRHRRLRSVGLSLQNASPQEVAELEKSGITVFGR
jgi:hypothetical protein